VNFRCPAVDLELKTERLALKSPFRISGYTFTDAEVLAVTVRAAGAIGRGEANGVYYLGDDLARMTEQVEAARGAVEAGLSREELREFLPAGGARNALDAALWELEARLTGRSIAEIAGLGALRPLRTTFTIGAEAPAEMARIAQDYRQAKAVKLKLTGEVDLDIERVRAVRAARPDVWIGVDGNQGFEAGDLGRLLPVLLEARVGLLEQPLARGREADLDGVPRPLPFAADESVQDFGDIAGLVGRFDVVNIKLDKCGGLTEGLLMAAAAKRLGLTPMVGCMTGSSLAMAPAFVLGQLCDLVDLDGPIFLARDRAPGATYENGEIWCGDAVWGGHAAMAE